jgi:HEAT repeat protein
VISALVRTMRFDTSVDVRLAAIEVLSGYRDQILVRQAFLDTAQDPQTNPLVQVELVLQLGQISDPAARLALEQMAVDDRLDRTVRLAAAQQVQASL